MGSELSALSWLRRYDTLLRARDEESKRDEVVRRIMTAKAACDVLPPAFQLARAIDPLGRRKRPVLPVVARDETPELDPPSRRFEPQRREGPSFFVQAALAVAHLEEPVSPVEEAEDDEPAALAELASAAAHAWSSIPPDAALVDDAATDPMAVPPTFTRPPPRIVVLGDPALDETTEPLDMSFVQEGSFPIELSPLRLSPLGVSPSHHPVARSERLFLSPPAPRLLELSPPPVDAFRNMPIVRSNRVELTPPSLPPAAVASPASEPRPPEAPAAPARAEVDPIPLPTFDLKNPWAARDDEEPAARPAPAKRTLSERMGVAGPVLRALGLAVAAATIGIAVRGALALRGTASDPRATAAVLPAPVVAQVAAVAPAAAPAAAPSPAVADGASGAKVQGTLEINAAPDVLVVVDGIERGRGPKLTLPLGTGYHMVRVGSGAPQLVQIRAKQTFTIDAAAKAEEAPAPAR